MEATILIVDNEESVRSSLQDYFIREGFKVIAVEDGVKALAILDQAQPDLIILDIHMPYMNGLEVCQYIRQKTGNTIGIIMISGTKKDMVDRVVGLEMGADIYFTKPFETRELLAQVRSLLRRMKVQQKAGHEAGWYVVDDYLRIHFERRIVEAGGKEVHLTRLEFDVLKYLAQHPGVPCGRSDLVDIIWGYEAGGDISDGAVNTCVAKLRAKIEPDPTNPRYIQSVHGIGYRFMDH